MERVLQFLDDLDDLVIRLPSMLQSSHAQRVCSYLLLGTLATLAVLAIRSLT